MKEGGSDGVESRPFSTKVLATSTEALMLGVLFRGAQKRGNGARPSCVCVCYHWIAVVGLRLFPRRMYDLVGRGSLFRGETLPIAASCQH